MPASVAGRCCSDHQVVSRAAQAPFAFRTAASMSGFHDSLQQSRYDDRNSCRTSGNSGGGVRSNKGINLTNRGSGGGHRTRRGVASVCRLRPWR
jgi:hypothetical protein